MKSRQNTGDKIQMLGNYVFDKLICNLAQANQILIKDCLTNADGHRQTEH